MAIALLQQTYLLPTQSEKVCRDWVGRFFFASFGNNQSRGLAILIHRHLQFRCNKEDGDEAGCDLLLLADSRPKGNIS